MDCCDVPCWSGVWMEIEGHGYMEISDRDERHHKPPPGWKLASISVNMMGASQIFRYVPAPLPMRAKFAPTDPVNRILVLGLLSGASMVAMPFVHALLGKGGIVA